jgi:hypothetical protein
LIGLQLRETGRQLMPITTVIVLIPKYSDQKEAV